MGCFSYICKECGKPILSNSFSGQECRLYRLEEGVVQQEMRGEYDSYGRTFTPDMKDSHQWRGSWAEHVDAHFDGGEGTGFAAVHEKCFTGTVPTTKSDDDPNQGWGEDGEYFADYDPDTEYE
jgi:hypothetical protein